MKIISHFRKTQAQITHTIICVSIAYVFVFFALRCFPIHFQQNGLLKHALNFSSIVRIKAIHASKLVEQSTLAANFIGNMNKLSFQQAQEFQTSGLVHLLAISGAQIVPVASLFSSIFASVFYYALRKRHTSIQLMLKIYKIKSTIHFLVSLFISLLFGCTGALLRVAGLSFLSRIKFIQSLSENSYIIIPNLIENTALKIILLLFLSIFFGNVFINYSFILSAIGASCAELSGIFVYSPLFKASGKNKLEIILEFLLQSHIGKHLIAAVMTSAFVGILLSPLVYNSLLNACLANICAIPIITFLVTPLALLVLIIPENQNLYFLTLKCLDFSLSLFQKIATTFSDHHTFINPFNKHNPLFTAEGLCYLNTLLIILWILVDILRHRKVFYMRSCMIAGHYRQTHSLNLYS